MVNLKGTSGGYEYKDFKLIADGTGKFFKTFQPRGLTPDNAKDLLMKDAEYATPEDHYFAHL